MTLRVIIEHGQPGYDKSIEVTQTNVELTLTTEGDRISGVNTRPHTIIAPGRKEEFYVYDTNSLVIREVPNVVVK